MNTSLHGSSIYIWVDQVSTTVYSPEDVEIIHSFLSALVGALDPASQCTLSRASSSDNSVARMGIAIEPLYWLEFEDNDRKSEKCL